MGRSRNKGKRKQSDTEIHFSADGDQLLSVSKDIKEEIARIVKNRGKERSVASLNATNHSRGCCGCRSCYVNPDIKKEEQAIIIWHRKYCQTFEEFKNNMELTTQTYMISVASLRVIISTLTYWDDPSPGIEGLTVVGSYAWLITSALRHLLDGHNTSQSLSEFYRESFENTKSLYQELAGAAEIFLDTADGYFQHVHRMRNDGQIIVKKMVEKWKLQDSDPLVTHPMIKPKRRRPRRRIGNGLDFEEDLEEDEKFFHVQLSNQKIVCCPKKNNSVWFPFVDLEPKEKVDVCHLFLQHTQDIIENATEDVRKITGTMSTIEKKEAESATVRSQAREITGAMRHFAKTYKKKGNHEEGEQQRISHLVEEFWLALDRLHDDSYELLRLAQETRDIIRTCYIYLDAFYKWSMPDYDNFLLCVKKRKDKQDTKKAMKFFWEKLVTYNHEHRKLSEVMKFLSLSDFTSSVYQLVVAKHPIQADGISMKLGCYDEDIPEPWGLVGTDLRKSSSNNKSKSKLESSSY